MSLLERRERPRRLARLVIPPQRVPPLPTLPDEDLVDEGKELFQNFVLEDIQRVGTDISLEELTAQISTPAGYQNPLWAKTGRELRYMADEFARTEERKRLRRRAGQVDVNNVTMEQFRDLLSELFLQGGARKERVMILFCFCSDLALQGLRFGTRICRQLVSWSVQFISDTVCSIVQTLGGWSEVLHRRGMDPVGYFAVAVLAVVGTVVIMKLWNR